MNGKKRAKVYATCILLAVLGTSALIMGMRPMIWYDQQGRDVVMDLESQFDLPVEAGETRESIYHGGFAYLTLGGWKTGSKVSVYGVESASLQDQLIAYASLLVNEQRMNDVVMEFHPARSFVTEGAWSRLIETEPLRMERIKATSSSRKTAD